MTLFNSITETIGETPLVRLNRITPPGTEVYVKIEKGNPAGSIKDRAALQMINDAVARGALKEGGTIVEPTSGNTGIAIAMVAAARGFKAVIVMPDTMSKERISLMKAYGAEIILSPGAEGMKGAVDEAERICKERDGFICGQFDNPANATAHRTGTGKEILRDLPDVDYIFAGIGTGGTASGIAMALKDAGSKAKVIGIEPTESPLLTEGHAGPHKIQGIGAGFVPEVLNTQVYDEIMPIDNEVCFTTAKLLAKKEGVLVGISSGAALYAAIELAKRPENKGKTIVALLPDTGDRYYSTALFTE